MHIDHPDILIFPIEFLVDQGDCANACLDVVEGGEGELVFSVEACISRMLITSCRLFFTRWCTSCMRSSFWTRRSCWRPFSNSSSWFGLVAEPVAIIQKGEEQDEEDGAGDKGIPE